jgi:phosphohistidine phosphatase
MKRLVVLRHAKSDWPVGVADRDRPLGRRGQRDAPAAGRWIAEHVGVPDAVWCSPARRTKETWELLAAQLGGSPPVEFDERIYEASVSDLVEVLRETAKGSSSVLLVGHNPGVQELVLALAGGQRSEVQMLAETKFPTSGVALLDVNGPWRELAAGSARLADFAVPRG